MAGDTVRAAIEAAEVAAKQAGQALFRGWLGGKDADCCGFAWVEVKGLTTPQRRAFLANGFNESSRRRISRQFGHGAPTQSLSCLEAANEAAAAVLRQAGFDATMYSRMD